MPYKVNKTDPTKLPITVQPATIDDTSTSIVLAGRGVKNYGEQQQEDFVHILENFAAPTSPINPIEGQLWFDNTAIHKTLNIFTGEYVSGVSGVPGVPDVPDVPVWKALYVVDGGALVPSKQPTNPQLGQLWFDLSVSKALYFWDGVAWLPALPKPKTDWKIGLVF
jgi:hypothetical protein